jgi:hypothetical protein
MSNIQITSTGEATGFIPAPENKGKPITVIGTEAIRNGFDPGCIQQALNSRGAPGVTDLILNPDAHSGYGAPVGCVMVSPTHIYPGPVGVDIKCSMSLLQMNIPEDAIKSREIRRAIINAIGERIPTGAGRGQRSVKKSRAVGHDMGRRVPSPDIVDIRLQVPLSEIISPTSCSFLSRWQAMANLSLPSRAAMRLPMPRRLPNLSTERSIFTRKPERLGVALLNKCVRIGDHPFRMIPAPIIPPGSASTRECFAHSE